MDLLIFLLVSAVRLFLTIEQLLFLVRAVLSWIFMDDEGSVMNFLYRVTEPLIVPIRMILGKINGMNELPIDIPFFVTVILLSVIQLLLPTVYL